MATGVRARVPGPARLGTALALAEAAGVLLAGALLWPGVVPALAAAVVAVLVAHAADLHRPRLALGSVAELPGLLLAALAAAATLAFLGDGSPASAPLVLAGLVSGHALVLAGTRSLRRTGRLSRPVLVVGTGSRARLLGATLLAHPELGLRPVGFVAAGDRLEPTLARGLPGALLGPLTALPRLMSEAEVDAVVVADPPQAREAAAVAGLLASGAAVYAGPEVLRSLSAHARHPRERVAGVPLVALHARPAPAPVRAVHRAVELLAALLTLALALPVAVLLGVLVRLETGGFLVATDAGIRFRTRRARSVRRPGTTFAVSVPTGAGPVGGLLRRTRLDALPEGVLLLLRRVRYADGVTPERSAAPAVADQAQVDTGQLAR